jgi:hypothetical protein
VVNRDNEITSGNPRQKGGCSRRSSHRAECRCDLLAGNTQHTLAITATGHDSLPGISLFSPDFFARRDVSAPTVPCPQADAPRGFQWMMGIFFRLRWEKPFLTGQEQVSVACSTLMAIHLCGIHLQQETNKVVRLLPQMLPSALRHKRLLLLCLLQDRIRLPDKRHSHANARPDARPVHLRHAARKEDYVCLRSVKSVFQCG